MAAAGSTPTEIDTRSTISRLTEIADVLLGNGDMDIYDTTREALALRGVQWEYRGQDGSLHGPFSSAQIASWQAQGYLTGSTSVLIRRARPVRDGGCDSSGAGGHGDGEECKRSDDEAGGPDKKRARKAHEEVLGDFEDSDEELEEKDKLQTVHADAAPQAPVHAYVDWVSSDLIDFSHALPAGEANS